MKKFGISLVALVITIVVLIILTGAVIMTGINVPQGAQLAVFKSNVQTVQDAVTLKMLNNVADNASTGKIETYKWVGVASGYTEENAEDETAVTFGETINGIAVTPIDESMAQNMNMTATELSKYYVDANGIVYHEGQEFNGVTYYNTTTTLVGVRSIAIATPPTKTSYTAGETFDSTGMSITVTYEDNTTSTKSSGFTCSPSTALATANTVITVTYEGKTTTQDITVVAQRTVESIEIITPPNKTSYSGGGVFDPTGMVVKVTYSDNTTENITEGFIWDEEYVYGDGAFTITIEYEGKTDTVVVLNREIE